MDEKGEILKEPDLMSMRNDLFAISVSDHATRKTIGTFYTQYGKLLEPHGAVAWAGLQEYLKSEPDNSGKDPLCICLETAHPAKFREEINNVLKIKLKLPDSLSGIEFRNEEYISLENKYESLRNYITQYY
jgi:threonine synthase